MSGRPFIRNGKIVHNASNAERREARAKRFPGVGRRIGGSASALSPLIPSSSFSTPPPSPSSSNRPQVHSPGGTLYQQNLSPMKRAKKKTRRNASGYNNPSHSHSNMLSHWQAAATSPIPSDAKRNKTKLRKHLMNKNRHFQTSSPGGTNTGVIQGHSQGVLGHEPDASSDFNAIGHTRTRAENAAHNRMTSTYHGIESRTWSNASGASAPRYLSPRPDRGSHPSHWNSNHPDHVGNVPWHTWSKVPATSNSAHRTGRPFIRNGQIVFDATNAERRDAASKRFPGVGRKLND